MALVDNKNWIRSTFCEAGACVEVAIEVDKVCVRPSQATFFEVRFTRTEWGTFLEGVKNGEFDID